VNKKSNPFAATAAAVALSITLVGAIATAHAQESAASYPSKPVKLIAPVVAGGAPDVIGRTIAVRLGATLGQQFLVDNRPSAGGIVANEIVAKSQPDGYTLLMGDPGTMIVTPAVYNKLPYDPVKGFTLVQMIGNVPMYLVVPASMNISTFRELVALAKAKPGQLSYGSSGVASIHHLTVEMMKAQAGLDILHVPYKGSGQSVPAVLAGQVNMIFSGLPAVAPHLKSGALKALVVTTNQRSPQAPDIPTFAEVGVPGMDLPADMGVFAPAGTPPAIIEKLAAEISKAVKHPETTQRLVAMGINPIFEAAGSADAHAAKFKGQIDKYSAVAKAAGLKVE
jgi:tripartite-type tricarboxylate transporter receptor subunit TctC